MHDHRHPKGVNSFRGEMQNIGCSVTTTECYPNTFCGMGVTKTTILGVLGETTIFYSVANS